MHDFTFEDYDLFQLSGFLHAIKQLIKVYNHPRTIELEDAIVAKIEIIGSTICPLCVAAEKDCNVCPWTTINNTFCKDTRFFFSSPTREDIILHLERLHLWKTKFEERIKEIHKPLRDSIK